MIFEGLSAGLFGYISDYLLWWGLYLSLILHTWCFFRLFPIKKFRKLGVVIGNALITLCLLGCIAIAMESYLRFAAVETDSFGQSLPARRWFVLNTKLNAEGYRDREWKKNKSPDVRRIAFIGDSFTYGWGIKRVEDRFTDLLQAMFDQRSPDKVEVMNVSKPGWNSAQQLQPIQQAISQFDVDEIVLCYVLNDIEGLIPVTDEFNPTRPPSWQWLNLDSSCLMDYLYRTIYLPQISSVRGYHDWLAEGFADHFIWQKHEIQLNVLLQQCKENDVQFRVALLPYIVTSGEKFQPEKLHHTLRRFFEVNLIEVVDLLESISDVTPNELVVNSNDAHPNEKAHARFAEAIWKAFYQPGSP